MKNANTSSASLYSIDEAIRAVLECADLDGTDEDIDISKLLDELEMQREAKLENVLLYIKSRVALGKAIREEEKELANRRKVIEAQVESLKSYVSNSILSHGDKSFESARVKATFRASTATVCLLSDKPTDKDCPPEFLREKITREPNKEAIKAALEEGKEVAGWALEKRQNIQIK
jgi:hypothetical protein